MSSPRPRPITVKGFKDYFGEEFRSRQEMLDRICSVYQLYGFEPLETPAVENLDALGKFLPDKDRPNEGVFAWKDDGEWLALRYDLTAPLARVAAQFRNSLPTPYRRYAVGTVWRNEKPGPGRYRQFYQCDADTVGAATMAADAELCCLACEILETVGVQRDQYVVKLNSRNLLDGALVAAGILDQDDQDAFDKARGTVLRAIDKLDRLGTAGVKALLGTGRKDESGDYTQGAGLSDSQIAFIMEFLGTGGPDSARTLNHLAGMISDNELGRKGLAELEEIMELLGAQAIGASQCTIEPSIVRGLDYYTGPVMEAELTVEITDAKGRPRRFGSVIGGGRYDGLVKRFTGQEVPATGISVGVDRLLAALQELHPAQSTQSGPVVVTVMDRNRMSDYQKMVSELRRAGIRSELFLGNARNFGRQMKYADLRNSPLAIIQGSDEFERGVVQVKDLELGKSIAETASHEEWKSRPTQWEVKRAELAAEIGQFLDRTGQLGSKNG